MSSIYEDQHDDQYLGCDSCGDVHYVGDVYAYCSTCGEDL